MRIAQKMNLRIKVSTFKKKQKKQKKQKKTKKINK